MEQYKGNHSLFGAWQELYSNNSVFDILQCDTISKHSCDGNPLTDSVHLTGNNSLTHLVCSLSDKRLTPEELESCYKETHILAEINWNVLPISKKCRRELSFCNEIRWFDNNKLQTTREGPIHDNECVVYEEKLLPYIYNQQPSYVHCLPRPEKLWPSEIEALKKIKLSGIQETSSITKVSENILSLNFWI